MKTRWILEFDYDADPEDRIEADLTDTLTATRGSVSIEGNRVAFEHGDDALWVKVRFANHVRTVERV